MFAKKIVCLANSRKMSGRCIAGKEYIGYNKFGAWIRPISARQSGELSLHEITCEKEGSPKLLDIITIPLKKLSPKAYQVENALIDSSKKWVKHRELNKNFVSKILDDVPTLWSNGRHSSNGLNDRVPIEEAEQKIRSSLVLIKPDSFSIHVEQEKSGKKARAKFKYKGIDYWLVITDPIEDKYKKKPAGDYEIKGEIFLCVSLGEPYRGWCYKLVAGVKR
jgi:hypothetical protein